MLIRLFIPGIPVPGGSKRGFIPKGWTRPVIVDANKKTKPWMQACKAAAIEATKADPRFPVPRGTPLVVNFIFIMPRIGGHFGSGKNAGVLKPNAPTFPTVKPDATKLMRSTEDALTGILWSDDCQVVSPRPLKIYGTVPGALVTVRLAGVADAEAARKTIAEFEGKAENAA